MIPLLIAMACPALMVWLKLRRPGPPAAWLALCAVGALLARTVERADRRCLGCRSEFPNATERARHERVCHVD